MESWAENLPLVDYFQTSLRDNFEKPGFPKKSGLFSNYTLQGHQLNFYVIKSETEWSEIEDAPLVCNPLMLSTLRIARQRRTSSFGKERLAMTVKKCSIYDRLQCNYTTNNRNSKNTYNFCQMKY